MGKVKVKRRELILLRQEHYAGQVVERGAGDGGWEEDENEEDSGAGN